MASLPREVDSWSSGEVCRNIVEGTEDLKSEMSQDIIFVALSFEEAESLDKL